MSNETREDSAQKTGYVSPEFITERAQFYVDRTGKKVLVGCGDDRKVTAESSDKLSQQYADALPLREGYASVYGALAGIAKNVVIVGIAQHGAEFVQRIGGFAGAFHKGAEGMLKDDYSEAIIPALHSAEGNEGNPVSFDPQVGGKVGCAYGEGVGATSALLVEEDNSVIRDKARSDQVQIFGNDSPVNNLLKAHQIFLETATGGKGKDFAVDRTAYTDAKLPVMILAGSHTSAQTSGLLHNFDLHKIRNSAAANEQGKDFYNQDIAIVTAAVLRVFKDYDLDPELLMRAFVLDSTPVRAVLAASDADPELNGKLDPNNLPIGILGDPHTALIELQKIAAALRAA